MAHCRVDDIVNLPEPDISEDRRRLNVLEADGGVN